MHADYMMHHARTRTTTMQDDGARNAAMELAPSRGHGAHALVVFVVCCLVPNMCFPSQPVQLPHCPCIDVFVDLQICEMGDASAVCSVHHAHVYIYLPCRRERKNHGEERRKQNEISRKKKESHNDGRDSLTMCLLALPNHSALKLVMCENFENFSTRRDEAIQEHAGNRC